MLTGIVSPDELSEETVGAAALSEENDCSRFLSDFSQADVRISVFDVYDLPGLQEAEGVERTTRFAILVPNSEKGRELAEFYVTACRNRGWDVGLVENRPEALDWLLTR